MIITVVDHMMSIAVVLPPLGRYVNHHGTDSLLSMAVMLPPLGTYDNHSGTDFRQIIMAVP